MSISIATMGKFLPPKVIHGGFIKKEEEIVRPMILVKNVEENIKKDNDIKTDLITIKSLNWKD